MVTIVAWVVAIMAWVGGAAIYVVQYLHSYHITAAAQAEPPDRVAPVTFSAVVVLFLIIWRRGFPAGRTRLASAVVAALAAPLIFELPFDLIVMTRTYPPIPPNPALYRALFFVPLFAVEITTLLLSLSPMLQPTKVTLFSLALMLGVFAVWAGFGFDYPSSPVPLTLNIVSKLLAFAAVLTLFFPRPRPTRPGDSR